MSEERKTVRKRIKREEVVAVVCDRCLKRFTSEDWVELQEMLRWKMRGGWGSLIGDGDLVTLDLCQVCTQEVLGAFIRRHPEAD